MPTPTEPDLPLDLGAKDEASPALPTRWRFRRRYLLVLLVPVIMFSGAIMGMYFQPPLLKAFYGLTGLQPGGGSAAPIALPPNVEMPQRMAETMLPSDVIGLARLMPRGDVSVVAAPYGASDARIADLFVSVGQRVEKGAVLARLDNASALEGAVLTAEANLAVREATLMQTRATVQFSRDEAQATRDQAIASATEAAANLQRTESLFQRGVATEATLDAARAAADGARLAVTRAEATLARFSAIGLDDQPDVVVAARNVAAGKADLARARLDLQRAAVVAPIAGTILDINATPGQRPPADGIMQMGDTSRMMAEVEIWQDRIARVAVGQPVELVSAVLVRTLQGKVDSIGLTVGRQGLISDDAAENKDARVIRVLVALDAASSDIAARFTNLEAIARIDTSGTGTAP
ncbi:MAG: HlyD family efflux transporter periplasmic adaptor subunit [Tabrizicola sp.]|uniref:HlyD family efflux transporter periplasmic adaptor subunit n=1 Tax=Tabrizicola sp. TaxID=2005166 RepID=UPI0027336B7A|nr:HlyD family efflux transporter periplasmic adaptor subunit [Tabrizicola sp.]MDP3261819.1 HlyD family efflux transporter periplasmic adaptor subunit [Tabrizicola sp.]MDP3649573.1 HlyD family efflux transporter periplasmic adaptor subunit [Paracoccaceae bacterium]MDZ4069528.1 HlyD family efflux transporter periplasmic adaptor subunit [Tabrizicola sp.]